MQCFSSIVVFITMKAHNLCYVYEYVRLLLSLAADVHKPLCGATLKGSNYHLTPYHG